MDVVECTSKGTKYWHPERPHIKFWDLPGCGTVREGAKTYFPKWQLYAFDCLLIVTHRSIWASDLQLAKIAKEHGMLTAILRNKEDNSLRAFARRHADLNSSQQESMHRAAAVQDYQGLFPFPSHLQAVA